MKDFIQINKKFEIKPILTATIINDIKNAINSAIKSGNKTRGVFNFIILY